MSDTEEFGGEGSGTKYTFGSTDMREKFKVNVPPSSASTANVAVMSVATIGAVEAFLPGDCFSSYIDRIEQFFLINRVEETLKTAYFISICGNEVYKTLKSLSAPVKPSALKFTDMLSMLEKHYAPKINVRTERYKFQCASQNIGETINEFVVRIRSLAETCDFGRCIPETIRDAGKIKNLILEDALLDRFIVGVRNEKIQNVLLNKVHLNFSESVDVANNMEMSMKEQESLKPGNVNVVSRYREQSRGRTSRSSRRSSSPSYESKSRDRRQHFQQSRSPSACESCGRRGSYHNREQCPAKNWECFNCNDIGHVAALCPMPKRG